MFLCCALIRGRSALRVKYILLFSLCYVISKNTALERVDRLPVGVLGFRRFLTSMFYCGFESLILNVVVSHGYQSSLDD